MLQPTSPLRQPGYVTASIEKLIKGGFDAVWTVSETDSKAHPLKQLVIRKDNLDYYDPAGANIIARQQLTPVYHKNGVAYAITRDCIINKKSIKGDKTSFILINEIMANITAINHFLFTLSPSAPNTILPMILASGIPAAPRLAIVVSRPTSIRYGMTWVTAVPTIVC